MPKGSLAKWARRMVPTYSAVLMGLIVKDAANRPAPQWPWRIGMFVDTPDLGSAMMTELERAGVKCVFQLPASMPVFEAANAVERERPDLVFAELARASREPSEWISGIRTSGDSPLVIGLHASADPDVLIAALRGGASEFVSLPLQPGLMECLDRMTTLLESRLSAAVEQGRVLGVLSAKGGCGATTLACHLGAALKKSVVVDLDRQSPNAHRVLRAGSQHTIHGAFASVRRLSSASWGEQVTRVVGGPDLLSGSNAPDLQMPEPWRVDSCFRFLTRQYRWVLVDLGRQLNPECWGFLQSVNELYLVTAPDVLALYQTRSVLQAISGRGFDKNRVRLVLNRIYDSPQDFWIESIEQMFEMNVFAVLPHDGAPFSTPPGSPFQFAGTTFYGKAVTKLAARIATPAQSKKAA